MGNPYQVNITPGTSIDGAAHELCIAARAHGSSTMVFNDVRLDASRDTHITDVLAEWSEIQNAKHLERDLAKQREKEELRLLRSLFPAAKMVANECGPDITPSNGAVDALKAIIVKIESLKAADGTGSK